MKCGIIGLPNVGKSTVFNCLSNTKSQAANYPFCTIEPNFGVISVPDPRIFELNNIIEPHKLIPAVIEIVDIAGLVKGASKGEGLGNKFLSNIRETHAMIHILRCFDNKNIIHINNNLNPIRDKEIIDIELQIKDLEIIEKHIKKIENYNKNHQNYNETLFNLLKIIKSQLLKSKNIRDLSFNKLEKSYIDNLQLITAKPVLYVCNVDEKSVINGNLYTKKFKKSLYNKENAEILILSAQIESEIAELNSLQERNFFLSKMGLLEPGINRIIRAAYNLLNMHTFFTIGKKEVRAWTIKKGTTASKAAKVIHSDFEKGFICAKVIKYYDYIKFQSEKKIRELGKITIEGRKYVIQDGDIIHFEFNV